MSNIHPQIHRGHKAAAGKQGKPFQFEMLMSCLVNLTIFSIHSSQLKQPLFSI